MTIQGIKEIDFAQAYLGKAIPTDKSEKYIAKDFVLNLGGEKIKLSKNDTLRDVVRKVNLKSHVTGVRAKAVKGQLFLESTRKGGGQHPGITLPQKASGEGMSLNANQIIANYLASIPAKVSNGIQVWNEDEHNLYLLNELPQLSSDKESVYYSYSENEEELFDEHGEIGNNLIENQIIDVPQVLIQQPINLPPNIMPVNLNNYEQYIDQLKQSERHKLDTVINKKLVTFKSEYPEKNIVSKNASLKDKFVFCLKEIKNNRMLNF